MALIFIRLHNIKPEDERVYRAVNTTFMAGVMQPAYCIIGQLHLADNDMATVKMPIPHLRGFISRIPIASNGLIALSDLQQPPVGT